MAQKPARSEVDRRTFLHLLSSAGGAALAGPFVSCGSDGAGPRTADAGGDARPDAGGPDGDAGSGGDALATGGKPIIGSIDGAQIGGAGLRVHTIYSPGSPVQAGDFSAAISPEGVGLLFVTDVGGKLRGLAVTRPTDAAIRIDAASTALATVFGSLGVLTVDPAQAARRLAAITPLATFKSLAAFLAANLPVRDLGAVVADAQFAALRDQVIAELLALGPLALAASPERGLVDGVLTPASAATHDLAQVTLKNSGWRFVTVARRELDASRGELRVVTPTLQDAQNPLPAAAPNLISGANPVTWGNLFTLQAGSAGTAVDPVDLVAKADVALLEYWVVGPGAAPGGKPLPPSVHLNAALPTTATVLFYLFAPLLDFVAGRESILGFLKQGSNLPEIAKLAGAVSAAGLNQAGLQAALNARGLDGIKGALVDMANAMLGLSGAIFSAAGLTTAALTLEVLGAVQGITSVFFSLYNVDKLAQQLLDAPPVGVVELSVKPIAHYTAQKIDEPHDFVAMPMSLNTLGHVLYVALDSPINGRPVVVFIKPESKTRLELPQPDITGLSRLNVLDHFAYGVVDGSDYKTLFWDGTQARDIGAFRSPAQTFAGAINDSDQLIGPSVSGVERHMYRWKDQPGFQLQDTGIITASPSTAFALNNKGQAVFYRATPAAPPALYDWEIVLSSDGQPDVVIADKAFAVANGNYPVFINDAGQIAYSGIDGLVHLWQAGADTILPRLPDDPGDQSFSYGLLDMNNHGWVLGYGGAPGVTGIPLVLWADGGVYRVRDLVDFDGVVVDLEGGLGALNDVGQIITRGRGAEANAPYFLTLLTPKKA
jgi:hypothetical protein